MAMALVAGCGIFEVDNCVSCPLYSLSTSALGITGTL